MHQARAAGDVHVAAKMSVLHDKTSAPAKRSDDGAFRCYRRRPKRCRAALATALQKFSEAPLFAFPSLWAAPKALAKSPIPQIFR